MNLEEYFEKLHQMAAKDKRRRDADKKNNNQSSRDLH